MENKICRMVKDGKNEHLIKEEIIEYIAKQNGSFGKLCTAGHRLGITEEMGKIINSMIFPE